MQLGRLCTNDSFSQAACHRARARSLLAASLGSSAQQFQTEYIMWSRLKSKQLKGNPSALQRHWERAGTDISIAPLPFHSREMTATSLLSCSLNHHWRINVFWLQTYGGLLSWSDGKALRFKPSAWHHGVKLSTWLALIYAVSFRGPRSDPCQG